MHTNDWSEKEKQADWFVWELPLAHWHHTGTSFLCSPSFSFIFSIIVAAAEAPADIFFMQWEHGIPSVAHVISYH
jgi:hypothetical protein